MWPLRTQTRSYQPMRRFQRSCTTGLLEAISWFQMPRLSGTGFNLEEVTQTHSRTTKLKSWEWATWVSMPTYLPGVLLSAFSLPPGCPALRQLQLPLTMALRWSLYKLLMGSPQSTVIALQPPAPLLSSERLLRPPAALWCPASPDSSEGGYLISSTHKG